MTKNTAMIVADLFATTLANLLTLLTVIFTAHQQREREIRTRAWEIEDRKVLAIHVAATSDALAEKVQTTSDALALKVSETTNSLQAAIADNTVKTEGAAAAAHEAYKEANHVNLKIQTLGLRLATENEPPSNLRRRATDK